jgi:hypothetical protein
MPTSARRVAGSVVAVALAGASAVASAADLGRCALLPKPAMRARLVLRQGVPAEVRGVVQRTVTDIWAREGVTLEWLAETRPASGYDEPDLWLLVGPNLLAGRSQAAVPTLGAVRFADGVALPRVDLSWAAARWWMALARSRAARWLSAPGAGDLSGPLPFVELAIRALAYAAAHEIGHFALASRIHDDSGLMREALDPRVVDAADVGVLGLMPQSRARLRLRLAEGVTCAEALRAAR